MKEAWTSLAPENKFAGMTLAEYITATAPFIDGQTAVANGKVARAAAVITKNLADAVTLRALNQVVAGIKADTMFGPDSGLYRACGYIPASERSAPTPLVPGAPVVKKNPTAMIDRLALVTTAWGQLAPETKFAGMTLAEFQAVTGPSLVARTNMDALAANQDSSIRTRDAAEKATRVLNNRVVASVISDVNYGKSSPLYGAMGYMTVS